VSFFPYAVAAWLFIVGLWGVVSSKNLVRTVLSLTVVQSFALVVQAHKRFGSIDPDDLRALRH
jgi:multicomponent Na+:H+ antiporter subunit C